MPSLVDSSDLVAYLQRELTAAEHVRAIMVLEAVSAQVRSRCGQEFTEGTSTVLLPAPDGLWLDLPQRPVTAVTTVAVSGSTVTDFTLHGNRLHRAGGWWQSAADPGIYGTVEVTYDHGYAIVPDDVRGAVLDMAAARMENPGGYSAERLGDYSYNRGPDAPDRVALDDLVRRYRRPVLSVPVVRG